MNAIVVYESFWGNTAAIAQAIASGIGSGTRSLTTAEATQAIVSQADLIVAGAPLLGFSLTTDSMRNNIRVSSGKAPTPPNLSCPSMRAWLAGLSNEHGRVASFETRFKWSPGSAAKTIMQGLVKAGFTPLDKPQRFIVTGTYGPLAKGEIERAQEWGASLARIFNN